MEEEDRPSPGTIAFASFLATILSLPIMFLFVLLGLAIDGAQLPTLLELGKAIIALPFLLLLGVLGVFLWPASVLLALLLTLAAAHLIVRSGPEERWRKRRLWLASGAAIGLMVVLSMQYTVRVERVLPYSDFDLIALAMAGVLTGMAAMQICRWVIGRMHD